MRLNSLYGQGFARVAAVTNRIDLAFPEGNAQACVDAARKCDAQGAAVVVFPELTLTGRTAGVLFRQTELISAVEAALSKILSDTRTLKPILVVGAPLRVEGSLYNCAILVHGGKILGITPKRFLALNDGCDERLFFSVPSVPTRQVTWGGRSVPFGEVQIEVTDLPGLVLGAEIGEELRAPISPGAVAALNGTTVLANPTSIPALAGQHRPWEDLLRVHSEVTATAYISAASGPGESSTDLAWNGQSLIYEAGTELARAHAPGTESITFADIDLQLLAQARLHSGFFQNDPRGGATASAEHSVVQVQLGMPLEDRGLLREISPFPFLSPAGTPTQMAARDTDYADVFTLQTSALVRRMNAIGQPNLVIGVSGGLDSTHALMVCVAAMESLGRPLTDIHAYSMPGFGTTRKTRQNAKALSEELQVTFAELDIRPTAETMLASLKHPYASGHEQHDVTFENVQAGLRTDYLFRLANQDNGIVVGTGDLSELALGWCTYGVGDQMSHYAVNAGLPKTLMQDLLRWKAKQAGTGTNLHAVLTAIVDTEISPELIPASSAASGQSTEATIGPYELQDFTLYYVLQYGFGPRRIGFLASVAWGHKYSQTQILHWLKVFYRRFFVNQFKRSALPNGPRLLLAGSLSPRTDWPMPSDASSSAWLDQINELETSWK